MISLRSTGCKRRNPKNAVTELVEKLYDGSMQLLFASLISEEKLTEQEREELQNLIDKM